jgi:cellulose synthase/poly-beta-1,6-N-acetylglucosamine synthase-like glycosyltransferase
VTSTFADNPAFDSDNEVLDGNHTTAVVIPARNAARTIERCIRRAFALDPEPAEVLVIDDASDDG